MNLIRSHPKITLAVVAMLSLWAGTVGPVIADEQTGNPIATLPEKLSCTAAKTAGFHDYPHNSEGYEPVVFFESEFILRINPVLMSHLSPTSPHDLFLTLRQDAELIELQCYLIRARGGQDGISCSSQPPADLLLLNLDTLRFTRTAIGGWTFSEEVANSDRGDGSGAQTDPMDGESIYVEYGQCRSR